MGGAVQLSYYIPRLAMMMKLAVLLAGIAVADAANATSTTAAVVGKYYSPWVVKVQEALAKVGAMQYPEGYPSGEAYSLRTQCGWCMETVSGSDSGHASIINVGRLVAVESMKALPKPSSSTTRRPSCPSASNSPMTCAGGMTVAS